MKLNKIQLKNYKQFSNSVLNFNGQVNIDILIGPNNSGKTTFMEALTKFLSRKSNGQFFFSIYDFPINLHSKLNEDFEKLYRLFLERDDKIDGVDLQKNKEDFNEVYKNFKLSLPYLELEFEYQIEELPAIKHFLYNLESHQKKEKLINFAIIYKPKNIYKLLKDYHRYLDKIEDLNEIKKSKKDSDCKTNRLLKQHFSKNLIGFLQRDNSLNKYFNCEVYVLNPYLENKKDGELANKFDEIFNKYSKTEFTNIEELIQIDTITAGRYLNDVDYEGRSIDISEKSIDKYSRISQLINSLAKKEISPEENSSIKLTKIERSLLIEKLSLEDDLKKIFEKTLNPLVSEFYGYPNLHSPSLEVFPDIDLNTTIRDEASIQLTMEDRDSNQTLPESYNGLGYRQLLFLHLKISNYLREFEEKRNNGEVHFHLLLIEEPEVNLHAPIKRILIEDISRQFKNDYSQVILSTHSNHLIDQVNFEQLHYIKVNDHKSKILNLEQVKLHDSKLGSSNNRFIQKYFELHSHDIFFADGIVVVEGNSENTLIPYYIKHDNYFKKLNSKYISFLNVGGAYIHKLIPLFEVLDKPVLIITDIDSGKIKNKVDNNKKEIGRPKKNPIDPKLLDELVTSNTLLKEYIGEDSSNVTIKQLLDRGPGQYKSHQNIYITFQHCEYKVNKKSVYARTFEDAFALRNSKEFADMDFKKEFDVQGRGLLTSFKNIFKKNDDKTDYGNELFKVITNDKKSDFSLDLIYYLTFKNNDSNEIKSKNITEIFSLPHYIEKGLVWLSRQLEQGGDQND